MGSVTALNPERLRRREVAFLLEVMLYSFCRNPYTCSKGAFGFASMS